MSTRTERHELSLSHGRVFRVDLTEAPDYVRVTISGARAKPKEVRRIATFLWPLLSRFETDTRPIDIDGAHGVPGRRLLTLGYGLIAHVPLDRPRTHA